jgi:hypothetical protein
MNTSVICESHSQKGHLSNFWILIFKNTSLLRKHYLHKFQIQGVNFYINMNFGTEINNIRK